MKLTYTVSLKAQVASEIDIGSVVKYKLQDLMDRMVSWHVTTQQINQATTHHSVSHSTHSTQQHQVSHSTQSNPHHSFSSTVSMTPPDIKRQLEITIVPKNGMDERHLAELVKAKFANDHHMQFSEAELSQVHQTEVHHHL